MGKRWIATVVSCFILGWPLQAALLSKLFPAKYAKTTDKCSEVKVELIPAEGFYQEQDFCGGRYKNPVMCNLEALHTHQVAGVVASLQKQFAYTPLHVQVNLHDQHESSLRGAFELAGFVRWEEFCQSCKPWLIHWNGCEPTHKREHTAAAVTYIFSQNDAGELVCLLVKAKKCDFFWAPGGLLNPGEHDASRAAAREVQEEVGAKLTTKPFMELDVTEEGVNGITDLSGVARHFLYYSSTAFSAGVRLETREIQDSCWFTFHDLFYMSEQEICPLARQIMWRGFLYQQFHDKAGFDTEDKILCGDKKYRSVVRTRILQDSSIRQS